MAKRYLGSPNEELDLMFAELESIDRTTKEGRRAYHALARKIRRARGSRMFSGLKGLLSRKYPVPAGASGAASTMGFAGVPEIPFTMGTSLGLGTNAQTQPQPQIPIEEILVSASKREVPEAKPQFDVSSKLGRNQLRSLQKRARRMRETPDAYERNPDYAIEFLPDYLRSQYRDELMQLAGRYNEGKTIEQLIKDKKQQEKSDERLEKFFEAYEKNPDSFSKDMIEYMKENEPEKKAGGGQLMGQAQQLANAGRGDDTMLMHVTPDEVAGIASLAPGLMTTNPQTGLPEAGLFRDILGFGLPFLLPMLVPGLGAVAAGALGGAGGAAIRGGDFKDILLGGATGALGGKFTENLAQTGAQTAGLTENLASTAVDSTAAIPTQALANANKLSSVLTPEQLVNVENLTGGGMNLGSALGSMDLPASQMANINQALTPAIGDAAGQIGSLSNMGGTGEIFGNIKSAGLGGLQNELMSLEGLGLIGGTGLQATRDTERRYQDMLANMKREEEEREAEIYRMNPENIPYYAREGGSLYKKRYLDGDYS